MAAAIELKGITKTFGQTVAVRNFNLAVPQGALYGLIGPNGAGKTTMIRMMLAILFPDSGSLSILGHPSAIEAKDRIGYLPEERGVYKKMRVGEFLTFMARLKGVADADIRQRMPEWLDRVGLPGSEKKRCEELSKGMQQKVQFITAVMHRPDLLILDEPFSGLDPVNQRLMRDLVMAEHQRGATILFSTHILAHAEQLCDHIVMIHLGNKMLDGRLADLQQSFDPRHILFAPLDPAADVQILRQTGGVQSMVRDGASWDIALEETADPASVIPALVAAATPAHIQLRRPSLEDVFIAIASEAIASEAASTRDARTSLRAALREEEGKGGGQ